MELEPPHDPVRRWVAAFNERDTLTLVALADPEVDWYPLQISAHGHFKGHDGIRRWMEELGADDPDHRVRVDSVRTLAPDRVALLGAICVDDNPVSPYSLIAVVRDGKVLTARSYLSDADTLLRLGLLDG